MRLEDLKKKRLSYGISQKELAERAGVSEKHLLRIEGGQHKPIYETRAAIEAALEELRVLKSDCHLEVLIDYVRLHFMTKDVRHVVEKALCFPFDLMLREEYGHYGYSAMYRFGDICVMQSAEDDEDIYTLLELKGKGCRLFECHLEAIDWTWYDFFAHCLDYFPVRVKRLDLAIDDRDGILCVAELRQKCRAGEMESAWIKAYSGYESGQTLRREDKEKRMEMGDTVYIGAAKSEIYFCVYEKDFEQYKKQGIPVDEAPVKNRFEIRLKNDRAFKAVEDLVFRRDVDSTIFDIINRYVAFIDWVDGEQVINARWARFLGDGRGRLKLTIKPEPYTVERTKTWFRKQVAPSLVLLNVLDDMEGTVFVRETLDNASLSARHARILQQAASFKTKEEEV